ncbi:MAG: hypothetical protein NVSMB31_01410 [Vulcanimicrobiaceae bacterium]
MLVGREDTNGILSGPLGAYGLADLVDLLALPSKIVKSGLDECVKLELLAVDGNGVYAVPKWTEKAGISSRESTRAWREKRKRESSQDIHSEVTVKSPRTSGDALDKEIEVDKIDASASSAREDFAAPLGEDELTLPPMPKQKPVANRAREFGMWFVEEGIRRGAIPQHWRLNPGKLLGESELLAARGLLETYGSFACEAAAKRLFDRKLDTTHKQGPLNARVTLSLLERQWSWFVAEPKAATDAGAEYAGISHKDIA